MSEVKEDLHIHSVVSDGEMIPGQIIRIASKNGLKRISITDHDALGAYTHFSPDPVILAKQQGITLIRGVELDCIYRGREAHLLGYDIDIHNGPLTAYLQEVKELRWVRIKELIGGINRGLGRNLLQESDVHHPQRDTYMKPHVIRPLVKRNIFPTYQQAARWVSRQVPSTTDIPKPSIEKAIAMVKAAGGWPVIAHPGFRIIDDPLDPDTMIRELVELGISGVEVYYPYRFPEEVVSGRKVMEFRQDLLALCRRHQLTATRGSDSHTLREFIQN